MKKTWELSLMSDLVKAGMIEDGEGVIRELWYVVAVDATGRRFRYHDMTQQHEAEERLALFVLNGGVDPVRSDGWDEMYPVYGSPAYEAEEPEIVAAERRQEMDEAAMGPPPGSWAAVARMMAAGDDSGFDWDAWKDEMKERDL